MIESNAKYECIRCNGHPASCYHCLGNGYVSYEVAYKDAIMNLAEYLALCRVQRMKRHRAEDPEGEDWAFCAAESMMSEADYTNLKQYEEEQKIIEQLKLVPESLLEDLIDSVSAMPKIIEGT